jgi:hypothetical protein
MRRGILRLCAHGNNVVNLSKQTRLFSTATAKQMDFRKLIHTPSSLVPEVYIGNFIIASLSLFF